MNDGKYDFASDIGMYTGNGRQGEGGDLVVYEPIEDQVYAYGQKDYRGGNTKNETVIWTNGSFVPCDKIGRIK